MKNGAVLGKGLIAFGSVILVGLFANHFYAAAHHQVQSFDEYGNWVAVPFLGAVSVTLGLFLIAFSGNNKGR